MQLLTYLSSLFRPAFIQRWAVYERTYRELSEFSDRQLADIGIQRSRIPEIAREPALRAAPIAPKTGEAAKTRKVSGRVATAN